MGKLNDFKLLNIKSENYFNILETELNQQINLPSTKHKQRFGFYIFMLESLCNIKDTFDILDLITDQEFNSVVFENRDEDYGVDAVYIDEENNFINFFNFKYREKFNEDKKQGLNETFLSTKFTNAIVTENTDGLTGKVKEVAQNVIDKLNGNDIWKLRLYAISNESVELDTSAPEIKQLKELYDLEVIAIGLDTITKMMSLRPDPINATLHIEKDSILPFVENSLSSSKSYVARLSVPDLLRITCDDPSFREDYKTENFEELANKNMDYNLLFDNVRGLITKSKFNENIYQTLKDEPSKFFMFNNGLTITASDIESEDTNANKKVKLTIKDFQVVNGGQTLRTLHRFNLNDPDNISNYLSDAEILVRIFKTSNSSGIRNKIAEYTNSQNAISNVDLKSLASEQILIEQYLDENDIIYARKIGDTGLVAQKNYVHKISMEKFGQILFSHQGFPEKASNQKKQIFDKYYSTIFSEPNFDLTSSADLVKLYFNIKKEYDNSSFSTTDQKIFYIIYLTKHIQLPILVLIKNFENTLTNYRKGEKISEARKLINTKFKDILDADKQNYV